MDGGRHDGFISKPYTRTGNNSTQDGLVEYSIEAKPEIKKIFEEAELPTPSFNQLKKNDNKAIDTFKNAIAKAKQSLGDYGSSVELKDDYTDINLYLSEDGESGFGIKPNGDIVSVFSNNKAEGGRSAYMLEMAISQGGRQLDCFDVYLVEIYEAHGFKPVAKMKWDDEYIPEGWNKDNFKDYNNGEPALTAGRRHVVFMVYDPNNDIEKKKKEAEEKYGKKNEIPYIIDYDMGEDAQHMYKWRSPAEREAIYNNMLERYKNAKTTEELKKVFSNSDKPFLRQMDDLNSLSKEQAQSIQAEYSKRYLELIKEENPEEYKKHKKYLEKKYNIKSDASYIDSLIDIIEYIDAKKKEFKESDVNRDEDGKFATKNSSKNKSNDKIKDNKDNDNKDNSNPKKSNCNIGDTYNIAINNIATIPAKKIAESNSYELYQYNDGDFSNLKPKNYKNIEDAIKNVSERYNELFNLYGMSDNQPTKKLKVIMLGKEYKKSLKTTAGFVLKQGREVEDDNSIFMNTNILKQYNVSEIEDAIIHETVHTIVNDNIRNKKMDNNITTILNEALAESGIIAMTGKNYREPVFYKDSLFNPKQKERMYINEVPAIEKINYLFRSKYNFVCNLMYEIYLQNNKNSDIFKDMINEAIEGNKQTLSSVLEAVGSKIGLEGNIDDILKTIAKKSYGADDKQSEIFIEMYHQGEKIWNR
ncbi:hypothetical protein EPJ69_02570 [Brachyspira aalborgi]|uniref:Uncharacterized protein n=1 Tax=Brachyspira aalborgi TaxID=29522 RepID=A0A5C8E8W7_9SPIR|nr:hypothetical protein [Brachyspira aalborgi]TXJ34206.1 hypothetical protein EPJ69_02570 [Brachyspira aalborgi]